MERINQSTVTDVHDRKRIDQYLAARFTYLSRSQWQKEIDAGRVHLNGNEIRDSHRRVRTGDVVSYRPENIQEPEVNREYSVLYEDEWYTVVDKPWNLPVHPAGPFLKNTLLMIMQEHRGEKLYPVHRLDRDTSGAIILARDRDSASSLQKSFKFVKKSYLAIVRGTVPEGRFTIDMPIGNDADSLVRKKRAAWPDAPERAVTGFNRIISGGGLSLIRADLLTGRLHQIRVHCQYSGHPIIGDKIYGGDESLYLEFIEKGLSPGLIMRLGFHRCALHSRFIRFYHPVLKKYIYITSPLPADMKALVSRILFDRT